MCTCTPCAEAELEVLAIGCAACEAGRAHMQTGPKPFVSQRGHRQMAHVAVPMPFMYGPQYGGAGGGVYAGVYPPHPAAVGFPPQYDAPHATAQLGGAQMGGAGASYPPGMHMGYYNLPAAMQGMHLGGGGMGEVAGQSGGGYAWRVVVHNLPWETSSEELLAAFANWNPQDAVVMKDRKTGFSKFALAAADVC
jgi:hypothetical protein